MPSGSTKSPTIRLANVPALLRFGVAAVHSGFLAFTITTATFHTDLCKLLREGGSGHNSCQLWEQGVLFNGEQVEFPLEAEWLFGLSGR